MTCELCWREATYVDSAAVDLARSGIPHGHIAYREQPLCYGHGSERRESNTARVRCLHVHLDMDGACYQCGDDCRSGATAAPGAGSEGEGQ